VELLNNLIHDRQSQPADGFGPQAFEELFLLKQVAEIIAANPAILNAEINTSAAVKAPEELKLPEQAEGTKTGSQEQDTIESRRGKTGNGGQMASDTFMPGYPFLDLPSYEVSTITNFDDIYPLDERLDGQPGGAPPQAGTVSDSNAGNTAAKTLPVLQAAEIDFSPRMEEIANTQKPQTDTAQSSAAPIAASKPPKKIFKDSNLIDWDLTDDS